MNEIDEFNSFFNTFDLIMSELYKQLIHSNELRECMREAASSIISEDEQLGLCILFSYDFMYITHLCICEYLENQIISQNNLKLLKDKIKCK
jgi:hypothetical protein